MSERPAVSGSDLPAVLLDDRRDTSTARSIEDDDLVHVMAGVLAAEGVGADAEAGLHLVDPAEISALNSRHMHTDGPTDVLSFPVDGADGSPGDPVAGPRLVGDVVLCPQVAAQNAADHAGTLEDECRLLVVHGALHLCGWDHADASGRAAMWRRERDLMSALGVAPAADPWGSG